MTPSSILRSRFTRACFMVAMTAGVALIASASWSYVEEGDLHPFLLEKGPLESPAVFAAALYLHVVSALCALPACLLLTSRRVIRRFPRVHRWLGRACAVLVLVVLVPSGVVLAPHARAGLPSTIGFVLSGAIVVVMMVRAVLLARARDFAAHRHAVAHVIGQLSVAVTSRVLLVALLFTSLGPETAYVLALWLPLITHVIVVERLFASTPTTDQGIQDDPSELRPLLSPAVRGAGAFGRLGQ